MKSKILSFVFILISTFCFGQKTLVLTAYNYLRDDQLDKAKNAIDEASVHEITTKWDKTWYYRGNIYLAMYNHQKFGALVPNPLQVAYESYKNALDIDAKGEFVQDIKLRLNLIFHYIFNEGVDQFKAKDYAKSLSSFEYALKIVPGDSSATLNAAFSADKAGNAKVATEYYIKLKEMKFNDPKVYRSLSDNYKTSGDTMSALMTIKEARERWPEDLDLILSEINIYLPMGKKKEAIDLLTLAITKEPENEGLHFALGTVYDNLSNPKDGNGRDLPKPENKDELTKSAVACYTKALQLKPDMFDANYNMGVMYFNSAAEVYNVTSKLPVSKAKEYAEGKKKYKEMFMTAQPYFEKAMQANPNDRSTMLNLRELYAKTDQLDKAAEIGKKLDAQK